MYDPATGAWSEAASPEAAPIFHTANLLPDGKVLIAGGYNSPRVSLSGAALYDPESGTWSDRNLNAARNSHTATLLPSGKVLVAGGYDWNRRFSLSSAELYQSTGPLDSTTNLNTPRDGHTATLLTNGKVLVAGGRLVTGNPSGGILNSAELYDPTASIPKIASTMVQGKNLIVFGEHFDLGAIILLNGEAQRTKHDGRNPDTTLIGKKVGRNAKPGDKLQVRNPNGTFSQEFILTGS